MDAIMVVLYVFALAAFVGIKLFPVYLRCSTLLMSATNAISGISLVGSLVTAGGQYNTLSMVLGLTAVVCATTNVVGGFMITERMLRMFKQKENRNARIASDGRQWMESLD